jgi:hypothetical protein
MMRFAALHCVLVHRIQQNRNTSTITQRNITNVMPNPELTPNEVINLILEALRTNDEPYADHGIEVRAYTLLVELLCKLRNCSCNRSLMCTAKQLSCLLPASWHCASHISAMRSSLWDEQKPCQRQMALAVDFRTAY